MTHSRILARDAALGIISKLRDAGHEAYLAGGCVRDALLKAEPKDYDVATDARPQRVRKLFVRTKAVGESFGVVLVEWRGHSIEVATFRQESGYQDGRRPTLVRYCDAEHDAQRRDFTINGMFLAPVPTGEGREDQIIDYVGGRADLAAGLIRAIGDPRERFGEDYLRMLRAVRFAAQLDFTIEAGTAESIHAHAKHIGRISRERIGMEVEAMLSGPRPAKAAILLRDLGLDEAIFDEPLVTQPCTHLERLAQSATYSTRLDTWISQRRPALSVARIRDALCLPNVVVDDLHGLQGIAAGANDWPSLSVAQKKRLIAARLWNQAILQWHAGNPDRLRGIEPDAEALKQDGIGVEPLPLVGGDDLIAMGLEPGPNFRRWLDGVYDAQLEGRVATREEALAWLRGNAE